MSACERVKIKKRKICLGDLKHYILIQRRDLKGKKFGELDLEESFSDILSCWAAVQTSNSTRSFNSVGTNALITHVFYIRYFQDCEVSPQDWVEFECNKYRIETIENLDQENQWLKLNCIKKGTKQLGGNLA